MSENSSAEIWQIDVNGQIYEAPFDEMAQWIAEGSLLRGDMVRKGSLRWIEAGRVPTLIQFFNAKEAGNPISRWLPLATIIPKHRISSRPRKSISPLPVF